MVALPSLHMASPGVEMHACTHTCTHLLRHYTCAFNLSPLFLPSLLCSGRAKVASVALMIIHQLAAFAYYVTPVMYMWERLIRTHNQPWYIRLPSRLPVSLVIWLIAMAFPFYGAINRCAP